MIREISRSQVRANTVSGQTTMTGRIPRGKLMLAVRPETFSERLKRLRIERGLTQEALADAAGISYDCASRAEYARTGVTAHTLYCLARALGVSMEDLFMGGTRDGQGRGEAVS